MIDSLLVNVTNNLSIYLPNSLGKMSTYIALEQEDWFENEIHFVRKMVKPGMNIIDIGANYGFYTLNMARNLAGNGNIWSFEPHPETYGFFKKSIEYNNFNNVEPVESAVSDHHGTASFSVSTNYELNSINFNETLHSSSLTVKINTLDYFMSEFNWQNIDFIKIDVEGHELDILKGSSQFLKKMSPLIMLELNQAEPKALMDLLSDKFSLYKLIPGPCILVPVDIDDNFSKILNIFCCKDDRADLLKQQGLLTDEKPAPLINEPAPDYWKEYLEKMPFAKNLLPKWSQVKPMPKPDYISYIKALNYYFMSYNEQLPADIRYKSLVCAYKELSGLKNITAKLPRVLTLIRVCQELGLRDQTLNLIYQIKETLFFTLNEPFVPVNSRFDNIEVNNTKEWVLASVIELNEKISSYSSYFSGLHNLELLEQFKALGIQNAEMERRIQLVKLRYKMIEKPELSILLTEKRSDNLNPEFWLKF